jgi:N-acyl-D-amino-acid deacylase
MGGKLMRKLLPLTIAGMLISTIVSAANYDIVIKNGRIMDPETGFDAIANVGISDGWITKITTEELSGDDVVDATGLAVTPGFIDTHIHSSNKFNIKMVMMDGVTSGMDFEAGSLNVGRWYDREAGQWPINYT